MSTIEPMPARSSRVGWITLLLVGCGLALTGCGAGIITGAIAGDRNRSQPPPVRPPSFQFITASVPLYARNAKPLVAVSLSNSEIPMAADIALTLEGGSVVRSVVGARITSTQALFFPDLVPFRDEFGLIEKPVVLTSRLTVDGRPIGDAVPFRLLAPPRAVLLGRSSPTEPVFVSANVRTNLEAELEGINSSGDLAATQFRVLAQVADGEVRELPVTGFERVGERVRVQWKTEVSDRIGPLGIAIEHTESGPSSAISGVYYEPWLTSTSPRAGSVVGGELVSLVGRGLAPLDANGAPSFDDVQLYVEKGSREARVGGRLRRDLSASNRLVFALPPSPDGRPGLAAARLRVKLADGPNGPIQSTQRGADLLVYGRRNPGFGPRGIPLTDRPVDIGFATLGAPAGPVPDAVVLQSVGGVAQLDVLRSYGNGLFSGSGRLVAGAEPADTLARDPRGLALGDFDGDSLTDVLVVHHGDVQRDRAHHSVLLGRMPPAAPLTLAPVVVEDVAGGISGFSIKLGSSPRDSLFVLSETGQPRLFESEGSTGSPLQFRSRSLPAAVLSDAPFRCATRMDLNGDGVMDLLLGDASPRPLVVAALGDGNGGFGRVLRTEFDVPGYTPSPGSRALALHGVTRSDTPERQIVLVLAGDPDESGTPGLVATLDFDRVTGTLRPPRATQVERFADEKIVASTLGRLDRDPVPELVLALRDKLPVTDSNPPVLLEWQAGGYRRSTAQADFGVEAMRGIVKLAIGSAVADSSGDVRFAALFVAHDSRFSSSVERRLSTFLAAPDSLELLAADASRQLAAAPKAVLLGRFVDAVPVVPAPEVLHAAFVFEEKITFERNDGLGRFSFDAEVITPGILPGSAVRVAAVGNTAVVGAGNRAADAIAYLADDGRVNVVDASQSVRRVLDFDLRQLAEGSKQGWPVDSSSRLYSAQVDGRDSEDLVFQLVLRDPGGQGELHTVIGLLRGRTTSSSTEVPFVVPDDPLVVRLDGSGVGITVGDFAPGGTGTLELAIAIPDTNRAGTGNHVRFCRFDPGTGNPAPLGRAGFVWSAANPDRPVLIAGDQPVQVVAADFNRDLRTDLAVVSRGDNRVRLYLQAFGVDGAEVDVERFVETLQSAPALPSGSVERIAVQDLNLDDLPDLLAVTDGGLGRKNYAFSYYPNDGEGGLRSGRSMPPIRTGNLIFAAGGGELVRNKPVSFAFGDLNNDGAPDLLVGWDDVTNNTARNLRVLFGGSR